MGGTYLGAGYPGNTYPGISTGIFGRVLKLFSKVLTDKLLTSLVSQK